MERQLRLAGFKEMIADTAAKQDMLHSLPPKSVTRVPRADSVYYLYADPDLCECLYVGRQAEYDRLNRLAAEMRAENQALYTNELAEDRKAGWGPTGPWGDWGGGFGGYGGENLRPDWDPY